jgi:chromate transport protein ChrA
MTSGDNPAIYFSLIAIGGGLGLIASYAVEKKEWMNRRDHQE